MVNEQKIKTGLSLLSQGLFKEADKIFCDILQETPDFPEALHGRACVARAAGEIALAIGFAGRAIEIEPQSYYYITLGWALYEGGHLVEAQTAFKNAILSEPYDPRAYHGLAIVQDALEDKAQAELSLRKAIELAPDSLIFWKELVRFYWQGKAFDQALNIAKDAVTNNPGKIEFLHELGLVLYQLGQLGDAERVFRKIIRLNPKIASAYANLGAILFQLNKLREAKAYLTEALKQAPEIIETQVNLGLVQMGLGALADAKILLENAYQHSPHDARIGLNLGTLYYELRELDKAEKLDHYLLEQAQNLALIQNDKDKIKNNLSTILLAKGQFQKGWQQMEVRHRLLHHFKEKEAIPVWNGKEKVDLLLVRVEQGLGDTIQFSRFLGALLQKYSIIIEAPKNLVRLLQEIMRSYNEGNSWQVIEMGQGLPQGITHQVMLMSLPYLLDINTVPLYSLDNSLFQETVPLVSSDHLKVGLCWFGNKDYRFDQLRSLAVSELFPLFSVPRIDFYALQTGLQKSDLLKGFAGMIPSGDLYKTACFLQELDLVISVDTVIAHLAGTLGKPVWLLNRFGGDWRWYPAHQDQYGYSLWYPSLKIYQQAQSLPPDQAWKSLIQEVKTDLIKMQSTAKN
ncbi:tetratricopeptide repeat protein [Commensalibacter papalotli (ex Servin-Garciduenas et al. 2014)]|uniref:Uncharacterized protein n=1 Tax=Commensalibacter papalotli (ex Servin-Garciduenas et al. 2014) TaxID=1208583 RepID=W7DP08_9PROT|nr:tetratricopeptide repeat protein [Commensalibacter papalotli (ex Servin-Garciduenas et al. 2014)]EUK19047.1 hypothetical protein COMX_04835 [Commensalibacter papalotli (ex Servin-Garciduenas et al. 2014)]